MKKRDILAVVLCSSLCSALVAKFVCRAKNPIEGIDPVENHVEGVDSVENHVEGIDPVENPIEEKISVVSIPATTVPELLVELGFAVDDVRFPLLVRVIEAQVVNLAFGRTYASLSELLASLNESRLTPSSTLRGRLRRALECVDVTTSTRDWYQFFNMEEPSNKVSIDVKYINMVVNSVSSYLVNNAQSSVVG